MPSFLDWFIAWQSILVTHQSFVLEEDRMGVKLKYNNRTDATVRSQYPHQTASGRREIRAASEQNNSRPASRLREARSSSERAGIAYGGTEPTVHDSQLISPSGEPHKPSAHDFEYEHKPLPSRPLSPIDTSALPYHASSSPPRESGLAAINLDAGRVPKTWTRNSILIPPRTRYGTPKPRVSCPYHMN